MKLSDSEHGSSWKRLLRKLGFVIFPGGWAATSFGVLWEEANLEFTDLEMLCGFFSTYRSPIKDRC